MNGKEALKDDGEKLQGDRNTLIYNEDALKGDTDVLKLTLRRNRKALKFDKATLKF